MFRLFYTSLSISFLLFTSLPTYSQPIAGIDESMQASFVEGVEKIEMLANLSSEEQKELVLELVREYKSTLDFLIRANGSAAEKRARVQTFIQSIEEAMISKVSKIHEVFENLDIDELKRLVSQNAEIQKLISPQNSKIVIDVLEYLKRQSDNIPEFEKKLQVLADVLQDVVEIWGDSYYNAFSSIDSEKDSGREELVNDFYYFKRESAAIYGIVRIMLDSNNFRDLKPNHMSEIAEHIQSLGLLYIKFAQSVSNIAIPFLKAKAKSEEKNKENLLAIQNTIEKLKEFQDGLPAISASYAESILRADIGHANGQKKHLLEQILKYIDFAKPLKSGTIGTTYQVTVPKKKSLFIQQRETTYIIKISRPSLTEELSHGQKIIKSLLTFSSVLFPSYLQWLTKFITSCFDSVGLSFKTEVNFKYEALNMRYYKMLLMLSSVNVPAVYFASENLLIMESVTQGENFDAFIEREVDSAYIEFLKKIEELEGLSLPKDQKKALLDKLYADHPIEKEKLNHFSDLYSQFLEALVYMTLPLGKIHGDLHPGNILVKKVNGKYKISFIDWGNAVDINGMIMDPIFLGVYTFLGNSTKMAERLYQLRDPKSTVTKEKIKEIVAEVLVANGQDPRGKTILKKTLDYFQALRSEVKDKPNSSSLSPHLEQTAEERSQSLGAISSDILIRLFKETDYLVSGKYIQFIRTSLPVGSSINKIITTLPMKERIRQSISSASRGFFMGYLKKLILQYPARMRSLIDEVSLGMDEKEKYLNRAKAPEEVIFKTNGDINEAFCKRILSRNRQ